MEGLDKYLTNEPMTNDIDDGEEVDVKKTTTNKFMVKDSPPLSAYQYKSHNAPMPLKCTNSYALLFEE